MQYVLPAATAAHVLPATTASVLPATARPVRQVNTTPVLPVITVFVLQAFSRVITTPAAIVRHPAPVRHPAATIPLLHVWDTFT